MGEGEGISYPLDKEMKIFQIGFGRTGTKSLSFALRAAGFSVLDMKKERLNRSKLIRMWKEKELSSLLALAQKYNVVEDHPWPFLYKELKKEFPQAFFIYTTRSPKEWLNSICNHTRTMRGPSEGKEMIFGYSQPFGHEEHYIKIFEKHRDDVRKFFHGDPHFLEVEISSIDSQRKVSSFLGVALGDLKIRNASTKRSSLRIN